jgi:hypothetical protein
MQKIFEHPDVQMKSVKQMCDDNLANILKEEGTSSKVRFHHVDGHPLILYLDTKKLEQDRFILMYVVAEFADEKPFILKYQIYESK